jgi:DNA-directed RNA polymerase subunit RPC12/RpoP
MEPGIAHSVDYFCYDCGKRLLDSEVNRFIRSDALRGNCRSLDEDELSTYVPLCNVCYELEQDEHEDEDGDESSSVSSETSEESSECSFFCMGCGKEIDWSITKEEFQEDELHLCTVCEVENTRTQDY